jgi:hypothetical protein
VTARWAALLLAALAAAGAWAGGERAAAGDDPSEPRAAAGDDSSSRVHAARLAGRRCRTSTVEIAAGASTRLALDCSVARARGGVRWLARGRQGRATRSIVVRPRYGTLTSFDRRRGRVRYRPRAGFVGSDSVEYRVRLHDGSRYRGRIRIRVVGASGPPAPAPAPPSPPAGAAPQPEPPPPAGDGLPEPLPPAPPSVAYGERNWQPTAYDTCPRELHDRFAVIGPDGKAYPTWHPPVITDPATGRPCTFGHEHGRDPGGSQLRDWVAEHLAASGRERYAGVPFGLATEALNAWAAAHPGTLTRQEDHVGYKVDYENDVRLLAADGRDIGVTCDYLVLVHQGSHSPDATANNVHELLYASRCTDGTELISDIVGRFGDPGEYTRACGDGPAIPTIANGYPGGEGSRRIPDRTCALADVLVPAGRTTSAWALYEKWSTVGELRTAAPDDPPLASFMSAFGVFDPSRYADPASAARIGRSLDLCREVEPNGDRANGVACDAAAQQGLGYPFDDPRSPFNGTHRDVYLQETTVRNDGGPRRWWTDPYGGNASPTPFPGAVCQLVGAVDNSVRPTLQERVFGRNRSNDADGVHAPN